MFKATVTAKIVWEKHKGAMQIPNNKIFDIIDFLLKLKRLKSSLKNKIFSATIEGIRRYGVINAIKKREQTKIKADKDLNFRSLNTNNTLRA